MGRMNIEADAKWGATMMMARHLRYDHGWGLRRIAKRLGVSDTRLAEALEVWGR